MVVKLNLYHISQGENKEYDSYSDAVVAAEDEDDASRIHPSEYVSCDEQGYFGYKEGEGGRTSFERSTNSWCSNASEVGVKLIGVAHKDIKRGVICSSFNAG